MSEQATAVRMSPDLAARDQPSRLAGLIDVLDRAEGAGAPRRTAVRRAVAPRPVDGRSGAVRTAPLRSVQPAPMARVPAAPARVVPEPAPAPGRGLAGLVRRAALWGSGPHGEHLAWRTRPAVAEPVVRAIPRPVAGPSRLRRLVRRAALWGSGPRGEHLAWGGPTVPVPTRTHDQPVVLREMPSTPTIQPAAPSPAAALLPRVPAPSAGTRGMPPVPRGAVAVPGVGPGGPPERSRASGRPVSPRVPSAAAGAARSRGDPLPGPAGGTPLPAPRSRSPGSAWSPRGP